MPRAWFGASSPTIERYAARIIEDPTYLYECFDMSTPASFLADYVMEEYVRADPHCMIFSLGGSVLMREQRGYVERTEADAMDRAIVIWYTHCERICSLLKNNFDASVHDHIQNTVTYPKMRPRLSAGEIRTHIERLRYQFENRVDMDSVKRYMTRLCLIEFSRCRR